MRIWRRASRRSSRKTLPASANWARRFRSGTAVNRCSNSRVVFATPDAKHCGRTTRLCSSGRRQKVSAAPVSCTCCRNAESLWNNRSRNSGRSLLKTAKRTITLAQLMSHQAGLVALDQAVEVDRLRGGRQGVGETEAALAAGHRARLPRAHLRLSNRRTGTADRFPLDRRILARGICRTTRPRHLDRFAGREE